MSNYGSGSKGQFSVQFNTPPQDRVDCGQLAAELLNTKRWAS